MSEMDGSMADAVEHQQPEGDEAEIILNLGAGTEPVDGDLADQDDEDTEAEDLAILTDEHRQGDQVNMEAIKSLSEVLTRQ